MIFVTNGTHEQAFNRLIRKMDELVESGVITEEVIAQIGYETEEPKHIKWERLFPYEMMSELYDQARIIITHGGPASFIMALEKNKIPIVVPRKAELGEHINDHQVIFCNEVANRKKNIIVVNDISTLGDVILNYNSIVACIPADAQSNNAKFCVGFEEIVKEVFHA